MPHVTLVMTRKPIDERFHTFASGGRMVRRSALFGRMAVVVGGRVTAANEFALPDVTSRQFVPGVMRNNDFITAVGNTVTANPRSTVQTIMLANRQIHLITDGTAVQVRHEFDTMERYRGDNGQFGAAGFMLTPARPRQPYELTFEEGNRIVAQVNPNGRCLRVHGHGLVQQRGGAAGILIHEAPHIGWLTGCISPRHTTDNRDPGRSVTTRTAMEEIFAAMGNERRALLIVLDG
jgi:hypothetical protein